MSIQNAINTSISGLRSTQVGIDIVARNIANADTDGYTVKSQNPIAQYTAGQVSGVDPGLIQRQVDTFVQQQLRTEIGIGAQVDVKAAFLARIDQFGEFGHCRRIRQTDRYPAGLCGKHENCNNE